MRTDLSGADGNVVPMLYPKIRKPLLGRGLCRARVGGAGLKVRAVGLSLFPRGALKN